MAAFNAIKTHNRAHAFGLRVTCGLHTAAVIRARHAEQNQHHRIDNIVLICRVLRNAARHISMPPTTGLQIWNAVTQSARAFQGPLDYSPFSAFS